MLYDVRTYTCKPGTIKKHLAIYEQYGFETQSRHLGQPVCYMQTETGDVNSYVHIWLYEDAADRAKKRAAMQADPAWAEFLRRSSEAGYLVSQRNQLMTPTSFFKPAK